MGDDPLFWLFLVWVTSIIGLAIILIGGFMCGAWRSRP